MAMHGAKGKYHRKGTKGSGKSELPKDEGKHMVPGFLGREKVTTAKARTGYLDGETKFGTGGKGRKISLPTGG